MMKTAPHTEEDVRSTRERILVADDHPMARKRAVELLQTTFNVVGTASDGQEMVSEAMRLNPEVIVADISMPRLDGIAAARQLRSNGCTAKLVFLTIYMQDEFVNACVANGALGYVLKSQMQSDLIPAVDAAISGRRYVSSKGGASL